MRTKTKNYHVHI